MSRKDRLSSMVGGQGTAPAPPVPAPVARTVVRKRALLYAPPPAPAGAYMQLLEAEGYDVLVAPDVAGTETLLRSAPPQLILAVVPALADEIRERWQALADGAEIRLLPAFADLLEDRVAGPGELLEFALRAISTLGRLVTDSHRVPAERPAQTLKLAQAAARSLGLVSRDRAAVAISAALREVARTLAVEDPLEGIDSLAPTDPREALSVERFEGRDLAELAAAMGCPFPVAVPPPEGLREGRKPVPQEVVEAAARYVRITEEGEPRPELALRRLAAQAEDGLHPAAVEAVLAAARSGRGATRGNLLLADGDAAGRTLLALRLTNEGYSVRCVPNGRVALEEVEREAPSLVLSEAVLPGLDGYALLDALKRAGHARIPFVFVSQRADSLSVNKGLLLGAADYLAKPVNLEILLTKLEKVLGQAVDPTSVSSRISLSDISPTQPMAFTTVTYEELAPGVRILDRFRIEADVGEGGMGKVFKARDERLEETVVLKVLKASLSGDSQLLEHFKREIRLARKISHPGVVRIHDFWEAGPLNFVTMEYLMGQDLRAELTRRGAFPLPVLLRLGAELFDALASAHEQGVVHRDIKPHNVLMLPSGRIKVLDFGIAQGLEPDTQDAVTLTTSVVGTPEYMSPEQVMGERLDARTDLYSAGILLYELLTGELPFSADTRLGTATQRLHLDAPRPSTRRAGVPPAVDALLERLLNRSREERYPSARAALAALEALKR